MNKKKKEKTSKGKGELRIRRIAREIGAILLFGGVLFFGISLLIFHGSFFQGKNLSFEEAGLTGEVGKEIASWLLTGFGYSAYILLVLMAVWGVHLLTPARARGFYGKLIGTPFLLFSSAALCKLSLGGKTGGNVGNWLENKVQLPFGELGSVILFSLGVAVSFTLATDFLLVENIKQLVRALRSRKKKEGFWPGLPLPRKEVPIKTPAPKPDGKEEKKSQKEPVLKGTLPSKQKKAPPSPVIPLKPLQFKGKLRLPGVDLLDEPKCNDNSETKSRIQKKASILEHTLKNFKIDAEVVEIQKGPVITQYELDLAAGIKVNRITALADDLAMALKAPSVRVLAPIPGKSTVGVEVPNAAREMVQFRDLIVLEEREKNIHAIPLFLGKDSAGHPLIEDLSKMPHLLIAGATGSGKSVCINSIILSILYTRTPEDVRFILIDPKMVELSFFREIPHLLAPVVNEMKRAPAVLEWAVRQMDERYYLLAKVGARNIEGYNLLGEKKIRSRLKDMPEEELNEFPFHLPYIVIIVDELADLMMVASKEVEAFITRLAQKSRAVGIHMILATQRPSVDVITGLIKSNMPARIAFKVPSKVDSRTILDQNGAEKLLGFGDLLYLAPRTSNVLRGQGTLVSEGEVQRVVSFLKDSGTVPSFKKELVQVQSGGDEFNRKDDLYDEAARIILTHERGSVSLLQRKLEIGYSRAARLVDMMAKDGIVGTYKGSKAREVLMTLEEWENRQAK